MTEHDLLVEPWLRSLEAPGVLARRTDAGHAWMEQQLIRFGDGLLPTFPLPFVVGSAHLDDWIQRSQSLADHIEGVAQTALGDRGLFDTLGLQPAAQELLRIDPGYRRITVLSRPDAIVDRGKLAFLEFNCDSPAMMAFADALTECLLALDPDARLRATPPGEDMTSALLATLLACWREFGGRDAAPHIAITDWEGQKTRYEHRRIAAAFERAGCPTVVCDPRAFRRDGRALEIDGRRIDVVYRRALFTELLERQEEVPALLGAYRDGAVCMVNSLRSYLASSKTLLALLCEREGIADVARTTFLTPARIATLLHGERPNVVKRGESHGGMHVLLPGVTTDDEWTRGLTLAAADPWPWVEQVYHPVPRMTVLAMADGQPRRESKFFNWNPFLFGGRYAGGIARVSDTPLINISLGGGLLPTWRAPA